MVIGEGDLCGHLGDENIELPTMSGSSGLLSSSHNISKTLANDSHFLMVSTSFLESSAEVAPTTVEVPDDAKEHSSHLLLYVLLPLGALVLIAVMSFLVIFILKKSKLDKLRHHLMPLYNFEPGDEDGDWESELLEEDKEQQMALHIGSPSPTVSPQLKFNTESLEV